MYFHLQLPTILYEYFVLVYLRANKLTYQVWYGQMKDDFVAAFTRSIVLYPLDTNYVKVYNKMRNL